jgi:hypothetical protein
MLIILSFSAPRIECWLQLHGMFDFLSEMKLCLTNSLCEMCATFTITRIAQAKRARLPALAKEVTMSVLHAEESQLQDAIKQDTAEAAAAHVSNLY